MRRIEILSRKKVVAESTVSKKKVSELADMVSEESILEEPKIALLRKEIEERRKKEEEEKVAREWMPK